MKHDSAIASLLTNFIISNLPPFAQIYSSYQIKILNSNMLSVFLNASCVATIFSVSFASKVRRQRRTSNINSQLENQRQANGPPAPQLEPQSDQPADAEAFYHELTEPPRRGSVDSLELQHNDRRPNSSLEERHALSEFSRDEDINSPLNSRISSPVVEAEQEPPGIQNESHAANHLPYSNPPPQPPPRPQVTAESDDELSSSESNPYLECFP